MAASSAVTIPSAASRFSGSHAAAGPIRYDSSVGNRVQDRRRHRDPVDPQIPCREKAAQIAESFPRPDVKTAFQRHAAVQADHRRRHRHIEQHHRGDPGQRLRRAESARHADPRTPDHAKDLRKHQVAEPERTMQTVLGGIRLGHGSAMLAQKAEPGPGKVRPPAMGGGRMQTALALTEPGRTLGHRRHALRSRPETSARRSPLRRAARVCCQPFTYTTQTLGA